MRITIALCVLIGALLAAAATAAGSGQPRGIQTFTGSCEFSGTVAFDPPLGASSQQTHAAADATGSCDGKLETRRGTRTLDGAKARYHAETDGTQSCASSQASGGGYLKLGRRRIRFTFSESRVVTTAPIELEGRGGGSFKGTATATGDPAEITQQCASTGLGEAGVEISGKTEPSISG